MDSISELYQELVGHRSYDGELRIDGFEEEDYEELYFTALEMLAPYIGNNYEAWYLRQCHKRNKFMRKQNTSYDYFDLFLETPYHMHSIRMQLTIIKYFVYRQYYSGYAKIKE